jgi:hypothetical protein
MMVAQPGLRWFVSPSGWLSPQRFLIPVVLVYLVAVARGCVSWLIVAGLLLSTCAPIVPALATIVWTASRPRVREAAA